MDTNASHDNTPIDEGALRAQITDLSAKLAGHEDASERAGKLVVNSFIVGRIAATLPAELANEVEDAIEKIAQDSARLGIRAASSALDADDIARNAVERSQSAGRRERFDAILQGAVQLGTQYFSFLESTRAQTAPLTSTPPGFGTVGPESDPNREEFQAKSIASSLLAMAMDMNVPYEKVPAELLTSLATRNGINPDVLFAEWSALQPVPATVEPEPTAVGAVDASAAVAAEATPS